MSLVAKISWWITKTHNDSLLLLHSLFEYVILNSEKVWYKLNCLLIAMLNLLILATILPESVNDKYFEIEPDQKRYILTGCLCVSLIMAFIFSKSHRVDEIYDFNDFNRFLGGYPNHD